MTGKINRGWIKDPRKPRPDEKIGGGFFVFRRGDATGRIRPPQWPFEHPTKERAEAEARRLAAMQPGKLFIVVQQSVEFSCPRDDDAGDDARLERIERQRELRQERCDDFDFTGEAP